MIGGREYALMKPTAYFITTARGFIHDEAALEAALRDKKIAGAGLDVWGKEPPASAHPLLRFDNVIVTAHTAGVTREARANIGRIAAEQMLDALDGRPVSASSIRRSGRITPNASSARSALRRGVNIRHPEVAAKAALEG